MSPLDATLETLGHLIAHPTVSDESNLALTAALAERLEDAGARVEIQTDPTGTKSNLWATLGPDIPGGLVLSGHTDVVPAGAGWSSDPFTLRVHDGRAYGRGSCDMKGFLACCLTALPAFAEAARHTPVHLAFTYDEEVGCLGAQALTDNLDARNIRPAMALIGEPTNLRIVDAHKGCCEYRVRVDGLEGHGSAPGLGVNALEYTNRYIARLLQHRDRLAAAPPLDSPYDPPHTTINIGTLRGGTATNVIPGHAQLDWEMRPVHWDDAAHVLADLDTFIAQTLLPGMRATHPDASITSEAIGEVIGFTRATENPMRDLAASLLGQNDTDAVAFGTEAGLFQALGAACIVCGPGSIAQAHTPDEFIEIAELERALEFLHALARRLQTPP